MPLEPLRESHDMYQRSFQAFIDNSNIREPAFLSLTQHGIRQALLKIIERVDIDKPLKVLGIGSGSGEIDLLILQNMADYLVSQKKKTPTIQNVIVEPSPFLLNQFKMKVSTLPPSHHSWRVQPMFPLNGIRKHSVNSTKKPPAKRTRSISFILSTVSITWT